MKRLPALVLTVLLTAACLFSGCNIGFPSRSAGTITGRIYGDPELYQTGSFTYDAQSVNSVEIDWCVGRIDLVCSDNPTLSVREAGESLPQEKQLHYLVRDGILRIQFWRSGLISSVDDKQKHITVEIPKNLNITVINTSGSIYADSVTAAHTVLDTVSGSINITALSADSAKISSVSGSMKIDQAQIANEFGAAGTSGSIKIGGLSAQTAGIGTTSGSISVNSAVIAGKLKLYSVSGSVDASNVSCDTAEISTTSGDVGMELASCGSVSAGTVSGSIDITLSSGLGATVEYKSISGRMSSALEYTVSEDKYIFGDGACRIFARTTSGDISIK
ncbi:MAG: DUF4097 family beta strand repeat-containing protein [Firmicutes bacterium]|nr:DUF4097 family beta strand repeat-containing protein [Bacillota bacterium]